MNATMIVVTAGIVSLAGGFRKEKKWPKNGVKAIASVLLLGWIFSYAQGTAVQPLATGIASLMLLSALFVTFKN